jgi:hypothetical protein
MTDILQRRYERLLRWDLHSRAFVASLGMLGLLLLTALSSVFGIRRMIRV